MAWIVTLIAINIFYNNSRLKYNDELINSIINKKSKKLIKKRQQENKYREKQRERIKKLNKEHQRVIFKFRRRESINSIAKSLKIGIRETRLVIKLYSKRGGDTL